MAHTVRERPQARSLLSASNKNRQCAVDSSRVVCCRATRSPVTIGVSADHGRAHLAGDAHYRRMVCDGRRQSRSARSHTRA